MHNLHNGIRQLQLDPIMARLIVKFGILDYPVPPDRFYNLVESIVSQQLSPKASDTILARLKQLTPITEADILNIPPESLRSVGLSWAKVRSIQDLSHRVSTGTLQLNELDSKTDEEVITYLTQVKGIGPWTAQMKLMFTLQRPDILPLSDVGIQRAFEILYKVARNDSENMLKVAESWRPYRTIACWYLWKSLDNA